MNDQIVSKVKKEINYIYDEVPSCLKCKFSKEDPEAGWSVADKYRLFCRILSPIGVFEVHPDARCDKFVKIS